MFAPCKIDILINYTLFITEAKMKSRYIYIFFMNLGFGGVFFTDWWSSLDNKKYFPKRPPQQVRLIFIRDPTTWHLSYILYLRSENFDWIIQISAFRIVQKLKIKPIEQLVFSFKRPKFDSQDKYKPAIGWCRVEMGQHYLVFKKFTPLVESQNFLNLVLV